MLSLLGKRALLNEEIKLNKGDIAAWMRAHGAEEYNIPCRVCTAFNECVITKNSMLCNLLFDYVNSSQPLNTMTSPTLQHIAVVADPVS